LAWAGDLVLGLPHTDAFTRWASGVRRHRATRACASASVPATACVPSEAIGRRRHYGRTRHGRARSSPRGTDFVCGPRRLDPIEPPLLRFGSPSARAGRDALSGAGIQNPCRPPDDPASAFVIPSTRAAPADQLDGSCALAVLRLRRSKAASLDLADDSGWFTLFVLAATCCGGSMSFSRPVVFRSFVRARSGGTGDRAHDDPTIRAPPL